MSRWIELPAAPELALEEERRIAETAAQFMIPTAPTSQFVSRLGQQLADAARREIESRHRREQGLRIAGIVGGGVLSVAGGVALWLLLRKRPSGAEAASLFPARANRRLAHAHTSARS